MANDTPPSTNSIDTAAIPAIATIAREEMAPSPTSATTHGAQRCRDRDHGQR